MKNGAKTKYRFVVAVCMAAMLFVALVFSFDFIAEKTHHDCTGENCEVCALLKIADHISGGDKEIPPVVAAENTAFCFGYDVFYPKIFSDDKTVTPVSLCDVLTI